MATAGDTDKQILTEFLLNEGNIIVEPTEDKDALSRRLMHYIAAIQGIEIYDLIKDHRDELSDITTKNIPQFSELSSIEKVLNIVESSVDGNLAYKNIGYFFNKDSTELAQHKYGENHYKLASSIGLATTNKPYEVTPLYYAYLLEERAIRKNLIAKLLMCIPVIQRILLNSEHEKYNVPDLLYKYISKSTARRRGSSIKQILNAIYTVMPETERVNMKNNIEWRYD